MWRQAGAEANAPNAAIAVDGVDIAAAAAKDKPAATGKEEIAADKAEDKEAAPVAQVAPTATTEAAAAAAGTTLSSALMEICVVTWAGHHLPIQAEPHVTIAEFKQTIGPQKGVDPQHFELHKTSESGIYESESELRDGQTLGDCGVDDKSGVALTLRKRTDAPADVEEEVCIGEE